MLSDADKMVFVDVTLEAAAMATDEITKLVKVLVGEFKKKGLQIIEPNKKSFQDAIQKSIPMESMGYAKADWDKIQAIK
jgi:TRAP-type C4-dicarboxylate transport system substrate-binding protein